MAYTTETLAYDTYERLKSSGAQVPPSIIPRLITLVPSALYVLPAKVRVEFGEVEAELYRKNYIVALASGQGDLSPHTGLANEAMWPSDIVKVTHPDAITANNAEGRLQRVGSETGLNLNRSLEFSYYAIADNTLYTMRNNDRTTLGNNATVRAGFTPLITSVQHEETLLQCLFDLVTIKVAA